MSPKNFLSKLWFLIEWVVTNRPSTYAAINFLSIIEPASKPLAVGETILVKKGKKTKHATIVVISENKKFILAELFHMRRIAAFNLQSKSGIKRQSRRLGVTGEGSSERDPMKSVEDDLQPPSPSPSSTLSSASSSSRSSFSPSYASSTQTSSTFLPSPARESSSDPLVSLNSSPTTLFTRKSLNASALKLSEAAPSASANLPVFGSPAPLTSSFLYSHVSSSRASTSKSTSRSSNPCAPETVPKKRKLSPKTKKENQPFPVETHDISVDADTNILDIWNQTLGVASKKINKIRESLSQAQNEIDWVGKTFINMNISPVDVPEVSKPACEENQIPKPWEKKVYPNDMVPIGKGKNLVPLSVLKQINWDQPRQATRLLMRALFDRETMASHSLTGKSSAAFKDDESKPQKERLDPEKVQDIIETVSKYSSGATDRKIRGTITSKLADENKLWRAREEKKNGNKNNKSEEAENV